MERQTLLPADDSALVLAFPDRRSVFRVLRAFDLNWRRLRGRLFFGVSARAAFSLPFLPALRFDFRNGQQHLAAIRDEYVIVTRSMALANKNARVACSHLAIG